MPSFGDAERKILSYFTVGTTFIYQGHTYTVDNAGKPTCAHGEPKTDIYIAASCSAGSKEFKISYKKCNADFIENKMSSDRAKQIFGEDWRSIISQSTKNIVSQFTNRFLIYKENFRKTKKGSITLGLKFELLNRESGDLSGEMILTNSQLYDIFAGNNLPIEKKNANINGSEIANSGVAEYILIKDNIYSAQEVIDTMETIKSYIQKQPKIFFACKALNYRTFKKKYDGDRPLAVQVEWSICNDKLSAKIIFDNPLEMKGTEMANKLKRCMEILSISDTDDITNNNTNITKIYS